MRVDDPVKMANIFNQYFVNVGSNLDNTIPRTRMSPVDYLKKRNGSSMFLAPVTTQEIDVIIQSLNTKKSIGPYSIPVFLLENLKQSYFKTSFIPCKFVFSNWYISRLFKGSKS